MDGTMWLGFAAASAAMGLVPGPGVISIVSYSLVAGRRVALASVAGMAVGNAVAITLSLAGVGALLAASGTAFAVVKWIGAAYLVGLGVVTIARSPKPALSNGRERPVVSARIAFASNVAVGTLHPKTIVFFVAFVPQFIDPAGDYLQQATVLVATFCIVVAGTDTLYALAASRASVLLRSPPAAMWTKRVGGGALIAAGLATAATRN